MATEGFDLSGLLQSLQGQDLSALLETAGAMFGDPPPDAPQPEPPQQNAAAYIHIVADDGDVFVSIAFVADEFRDACGRSVCFRVDV